MTCVVCCAKIEDDHWIKISQSRRRSLNGCYHENCWFETWDDRIRTDDEYRFVAVKKTTSD